MGVAGFMDSYIVEGRLELDVERMVIYDNLIRGPKQDLQKVYGPKSMD